MRAADSLGASPYDSFVKPVVALTHAGSHERAAGQAPSAPESLAAQVHG